MKALLRLFRRPAKAFELRTVNVALVIARAARKAAIVAALGLTLAIPVHAADTFPWILALERGGKWEVVPSLIKTKDACEGMGRSSLDPDGVSPAQSAICIEYRPKMLLGFVDGKGKYVSLQSTLTGSQVTR